MKINSLMYQLYKKKLEIENIMKQITDINNDIGCVNLYQMSLIEIADDKLTQKDKQSIKEYGYFVNQWTVGDSEDWFQGYFYFKVNNQKNKYIKVFYEC